MKTSPIPHKILYVSTVPPTQCGIATYTEDSIQALSQKFGNSIAFAICEITFNGQYNRSSSYVLDSKQKCSYASTAAKINADERISLVHVQHEFGLFGGSYGSYLFDFLEVLRKPIVFTFHTVLPNPNLELREVVQRLASYATAITVMTAASKKILMQDYSLDSALIKVVSHGTHLVQYEKTVVVKERLGLEQRPILSTFGLVSAGKSIETALYALPRVVQQFPNVLYLIIGKTHPNTITNGEDHYREFLEGIVDELELRANVMFINEYLPTPMLLDYLKATDVYIFTSKDSNQAVSGTFSYAMSCCCPVVASRIQHTLEVLTDDTGILVDIGNAAQYAAAILSLLKDPSNLEEMGLRAYGKSISACWENVALQLQLVYGSAVPLLSNLRYTLPAINWNHLKALTFPLGVVQFSKIGAPDLDSGYTLDDNARALIAAVKLFDVTADVTVIPSLLLYLNFVTNCQQLDGSFLNYVDAEVAFESKNYLENLEDANGRAIWGLGIVSASKHASLGSFSAIALRTILKALPRIMTLTSPRAAAFAIKGLHAAYQSDKDPRIYNCIGYLAELLAERYSETATGSWEWFENKLTYANSVLPEGLLLASAIYPERGYNQIAKVTMDFLLSKQFNNNEFKIISNRGWYEKGSLPQQFGEQPIEVCYMMQALDVFYRITDHLAYKNYMFIAFDWFLGKNHLQQIMYNPLTGGGYDGLEHANVNLNQGAESSICYLLARLLINETDYNYFNAALVERRIESAS